MNNGYKSKRKKVAIIGAGKMTKPLVDYFIDKFGYQVFLVNRTVSTAEKMDKDIDDILNALLD